jgi:hypothetical protein
MSSISQTSNQGSLPSSDNDSSRDYGDQDGFDILHPKDDDNDTTIDSSVVSIPPDKLRIKNRIEKILADNSKEYIDFISEIFYNWKLFGTKYPDKYADVIKYIDRRMA